MDVLLVAPQWIGDAVMAQPLVARLAARGERVTALALPAVAPVLRAMPGVAEVLEAPLAHGRLDLGPRLRLARQIRARGGGLGHGFTRAYVLGNNVKSRLVPWLARIPERIGYRGEARGLLLTDALPAPTGHADMRERYAALGGVAASGLPQPRLQVDAATAAATAARLGVPLGAIALCPGAEYGPAKQWPHFPELARLARAAGLPVLVLGTGRDAAAGAAIAAAAPGAIDLCGRTALSDAIALLAGCAGAVSNDSGLMHVAAALGRPTLGLYGSTDPRHTPPAAHRSATLWLQLDCSPCFQRQCPLGHLDCLRRIDAPRAWDALRTLMAA